MSYQCPVMLYYCPPHVPKCSINSVYLSLYSTYTYFCDRDGPMRRQALPLKLQGIDDMHIACVPSKRKGSIIEKNPQLPGSHRAGRVVEWFRIPGHRSRIDCKRCF